MPNRSNTSMDHRPCVWPARCANSLDAYRAGAVPPTKRCRRLCLVAVKRAGLAPGAAGWAERAPPAAVPPVRAPALRRPAVAAAAAAVALARAAVAAGAARYRACRFERARRSAHAMGSAPHTGCKTTRFPWRDAAPCNPFHAPADSGKPIPRWRVCSAVARERNDRIHGAHLQRNAAYHPGTVCGNR